MESFQMEIAGLAVDVQPLFESTKAYCHKYLTQRQPTCFVAVTEEDLAFEQRMLDIEAREEGMKLRKFTGPFLERAAIQRKIAAVLLAQATENIGMCLAKLPVIGITLPFMSYGGSSMLASYCLVGIVQSINAHRGKYFFERQKK